MQKEAAKQLIKVLKKGRKAAIAAKQLIKNTSQKKPLTHARHEAETDKERGPFKLNLKQHKNYKHFLGAPHKTTRGRYNFLEKKNTQLKLQKLQITYKPIYKLRNHAYV